MGRIFLAGVATIPLYFVVAKASWTLEGGEANATLIILACLLAASLLWIAAARAALSLGPGRTWSALLLILGFGVLFRGILLFSSPVHEKDLYRYLWDGWVSQAGISPYACAPQDVADAWAARGKEDVRSDDASPAARLASLLDSHEVGRDLLGRVYYPEVRTPYPPISQWVFRQVVGRDGTQRTLGDLVWRWRCTIIILDLAVWGLVIVMLRRSGASPLASIWYGWSPLLLKEVSNSSHLDPIATLLTVAAIVPLVGRTRSSPAARTWGWFGADVAAFVLLGLAIGAKIYPLVLWPILCARVWALQAPAARIKRAIRLLVLNGVLLGTLAFPMFSMLSQGAAESSGVGIFTRHWEMNDFLFMLVHENLKTDDQFPVATDPRTGASDVRRPWFVVLPASVRAQIADQVRGSVAWDPDRWDSPGALLARVLMGLMFVLLLLRWAMQVALGQDEAGFLERCFLTLVWLWLLSPTQNPWYLTWALPFLAFARAEAWRWLPVVSFLYYLRFWFLQQSFPDLSWWPSGWEAQFFDTVLVSLEFGPWLCLLAWQAWSDRSARSHWLAGGQEP